MEKPNHEVDIEKSAGTVAVSLRTNSSEHTALTPLHPSRYYQNSVHGTSGSKTLPDSKPEASSEFIPRNDMPLHANISANNLAVGLLGPLLFGLGFVDSAMCAFGRILMGAAATAYMSIWGAQSGNRTMIVLRYFMGYWPAKLPCVLNMILMIGYGTIDCIIGGQILSAVSGDTMSVVVGIVIIALVSWVVAVFGMAIFQKYERYAWAPQLFVLLILIGTAARSFNPSLQSTNIQTGKPLKAGPLTVARLSFFSLQLFVPVSWAAASSDFYVYYPENTKPWKCFSLTMLGLTLSFMFVNMIGIGLGSGTFANPAWKEAHAVSSGSLIVAAYSDLGTFGKVCGVIVALGLINNSVPGTYASALAFQVLGRYGKMVPRYLCVCIIVFIYFVSAVAGRNHLFDILQNFVALMGYWTMVMVVIVLAEQTLFKRGKRFDWEGWEDRKVLPLGIAAMVAFLVGWVGAIVGMYQHWYVGPVAKKVGGVGADIGVWIGCAFAMVVFVPLRWWELRRFGR
ncbi:MAG: hypothetical protein Q9176_006713 [Flavoplaca citrina]